MRPFETLSRRGLLLTLGAGGALAGSGRQALADPVFAEYPFQLGIAAGDPTPDGFVIWTRLAPRPMEIGHGMPSAPVPVKWEVATSRGFGNTVVRSGEAVARPELAHAVHVEVEGLEPLREIAREFGVVIADSHRAVPVDVCRTPRGVHGQAHPFPSPPV
jgi:alkaline phosphatase D